MIKNKFIATIVLLIGFVLALPAQAAHEPSENTINIVYPETLLHKKFYNSPHNLMVKVSGTVSGQKFHGAIPVLGIKAVNKQAFTEVEYSLKKMIQFMPDAIKFGILASNIKIVIIADAHGQKLTDMPEYDDLPSSYDDTEGVGATFYTKTQSIGEKNITCMDSSPKRAENVFIHELAHVIFDIGLGYYNPANYKDAPNPPLSPDSYNINQKTQQRMNKLFEAVTTVYEEAVKKNMYKHKTYMIENATEYFAEGTQSYFNGQARHDVNTLSEKYKITLRDSTSSIADKLGVSHKVAHNFIHHTVGINTYSRLLAFDPDLFTVMQKIYGKQAPWNFCSDMPTKFRSCRFYCETDHLRTDK